MNALFRMPSGIKANPQPHETNMIARAQSLLTRDGKIGPVLSYAEAVRVVARANKPRIKVPVTVPEPTKERETV